MTDNAHEFILGGQKSGKSRRAESAAGDWLAGAPGRRAVLIATAQAWDAEMTQRIARHRQERAERVPGLETVEEPLRLPELIGALSRPDTLLVVDCLTLWLTNLLMPPELDPQRAALPDWRTEALLLVEALSRAPGPVVLVGNEIGLGVIPLGEETRAFVDALGQLNQHVAAACRRVTLMVAGLPLTVKDNG
ncbi:MAG: bifunctional adenosylcobinamide kinase/adenosylcobinamide-phosphate guanylyltransferase [Gammaproteobacteria bacterium]|uniref:bifunctional adenosylcobinamide kinase/adenosylcobinamide-phosphate guanylyltransferase n=1 Tax=unclassified Pseudacidovorax TaxID=2620592 RepID=UPI001B56F11E|nr:bifunctional adenosylcobinamide kinase/adenosylcobinamide-phosphate guanylyltransferase [Pseudacidovorax sp.]MBP6896902.1 bifunctional adenosylcobinamide kinase/adenosylcobinamide-phosphate guanylyltransferase [Pseudacidovorax sp.]